MWAYRRINDVFTREIARQPTSLQSHQIVEITHWSLCGSDLRGLRTGRVNEFIGHECAGVLLSSRGERTSNVVSIFPIVPCFRCRICLSGDYRLCEVKKTHGFELPGATARLLSVDTRLIFQHSSGTNPADAVLAEHLASCIHVLNNAIEAGLQPGSRVCVIGDGAMAFGAATVFTKLLHCQSSIIVRHEARLLIARRIGFQSTVFGKHNWQKIVSNCDLLVLACPLTPDTIAIFQHHAPPFVAMISRQSEVVSQALVAGGARIIDSFAYRRRDFAEAVRIIDSQRDFFDYRPKIVNMSTLRHDGELTSLSKSSVKYSFEMD